MDVISYVDPKLLMVVAACWAFGFALKRTPQVPDWLIIWLVTCLSIVLAYMIVGPSPEAVMQGILCAAIAVYGNQLIKQTKEGVDQ